MGDFSGLNVALSALYAQRRGLEITGNNISNANTEGYSRQRIDLQAIGGPRTGTFFSRTLDTGGGVQVTGVSRMRDAFLEIRAALAHGDNGNLSRTQQSLGQVEALFNEPSDQSIAKSMSDFYSGWDDIANNPSDSAARQQLLSRATTLTETINTAATQLSQFRTDGINELSSLTAEVNTMSSNIAQLNDAIRGATSAGLNAGDLQDQRDLLVQQIASKVGATVRAGDNGQVNVFLNGSALVSGNSAMALKLDASTTPVVVRWAGSNNPATISSGDVGGLLGVVNTTLPSYSAALDAVAIKLRDDVNAVHTTGAGLDGVSGRKFFDGTGAADLTVSSDIGGNANNIAAAAVGSGTLDGSIALDIGEMATSDTSAQSAYRTMIVGLGVDTQNNQRRLDIQTKATDQVDGARDSASGVNTDEEMVSMVQYQHAYEAASRFMTSVDQMLDTLINRTGQVGR